MRPMKYYIVFEYGLAVAIAHGLEAARTRHAGSNGFRTALAAEEFYMWWNYAPPNGVNNRT